MRTPNGGRPACRSATFRREADQIAISGHHDYDIQHRSAPHRPWRRSRAAIGDAVHQAMVETIGVPADDRFQVISQPGGRLVYDPQDLGVSRDHGIVTIQVTQVTLACRRPVAKNETLLPADRGAARRMTGVEPRNVFVGLVEVGREDWSFGEGVAQYAMADRAAAGS